MRVDHVLTLALIALLSALLTLSGCAGPLAGPNLPNMTAEQLHEIARVKDASFSCLSAIYAGAKVNTIWINADKGIPLGVTVDSDCKVSFSATAGPTAGK